MHKEMKFVTLQLLPTVKPWFSKTPIIPTNAWSIEAPPTCSENDDLPARDGTLDRISKVRIVLIWSTQM